MAPTAVTTAKKTEYRSNSALSPLLIASMIRPKSNYRSCAP
jgi:hypothetical protein